MAEALAEPSVEAIEHALWDSATLSRTTTPGTDVDDTVMEGHLMRSNSAVLHSTPLSERTPSLNSLLPSAIRPNKHGDMKAPVIEDPNETIRGRPSLRDELVGGHDENPSSGRIVPVKPPRRSLLSRLSSIAERSFGSVTPRKVVKDKAEQSQQRQPQQTDLSRSDQNAHDGDEDRASDNTLTEEQQDRENDVDDASDKRESDDHNNNTQCASQIFPYADYGSDTLPIVRDVDSTTGSRTQSRSTTPTVSKTRTLSKGACNCQGCKAVLNQESFCDVPSEVSCSLASLSTPHRSLPSDAGNRHDGSHYDDVGQEAHELAEFTGSILNSPPADDGGTRLSQASLKNTRNSKLNDGVRRIGKFLRSTLVAGRRSISGSDSVSLASEISASPSSKRSFWTSKRFSSHTAQDIETTNVPQLLKRTGRISISSEDYTLRPGSCDSPQSFFGPDRDSDLLNASVTSIMVVLMPPGTAEPNESDSRIWLSATDSSEERRDQQRQLIVLDPILKVLLEDLTQVMADQEVILKQTSKVLDECGRYMGWAKANQGIVLAEQMLHVALQRYFLAESELQWYIDGGDFEPQRDRVVIREIRIPLREEFRANVAASKDQYVFLVLLKVGHRVEASDVLWMKPDDREIVVNGLWSHGIFKGPGGRPHLPLAKNSSLMAKLINKTKRRSPPSWSSVERLSENTALTEEVLKEDFNFSFNRADWKVDIEVYSFFLKRTRCASSQHINKLPRKMDHTRANQSPQSERRNSTRVNVERHIEVRKSSFGLLARATLSKDDVLTRRSVTLVGCLNPSPFESEIKIVGEAYLNDNVVYTALLNVKDYTGSFGRKGGMRSCIAKLDNTTLSFFTSNPTRPQDKEKPLRIFDLSNLTEDNIEMDTIEGLFFHGFTLYPSGDDVQSCVEQPSHQEPLAQINEEYVSREEAPPSRHDLEPHDANLTGEADPLSEFDAAADHERSIPASETPPPQPIDECLRLCTNSREQTFLWVEHLRRALRQARVVELA